MRRLSSFVSFFLVALMSYGQCVKEFTKKSGYNFGPATCSVNGKDAIWIGGEKGLARFSPTDEVEPFSGRTTSRPVLSMVDAESHLWVGIQNKGLYLFDKKNYQFKGYFKKELGQSDITIMVNGNSSLLILTRRGEAWKVLYKDTTITSVSAEERELLESAFNRNPIDDLYFRDIKFRVAEKQIWKISKEGKEAAVASIQSFSGPVIAANEFSEQYAAFTFPKGLLLYDSRLDSIKFPENPTERDQPVIKEKEEAAEKSIEKESIFTADQNDSKPTSEEIVTTGDSRSLIWIFPGALLLVLTVFFLMRNKYQKDIKILEDEIVRLKQPKSKDYE